MSFCSASYTHTHREGSGVQTHFLSCIKEGWEVLGIVHILHPSFQVINALKKQA